MIRVNHYGPDARPEVVIAALAALGVVLADSGVSVDVDGARNAALRAGQATESAATGEPAPSGQDGQAEDTGRARETEETGKTA
jgi:hypothetical protein